MIMRMLNNSVKVPVISSIFFIGEIFPELAFGQLFNKVGKSFGIGPGFVEQFFPVRLALNGRMIKTL